MSQATQYADMTVELTNLYNECSLDYYMQAWAPLFTSVSGFLNIIVSLATVILAYESEEIWIGMSLAAYELNASNAGKYFGLFMKATFGVEF